MSPCITSPGSTFVWTNNALLFSGVVLCFSEREQRHNLCISLAPSILVLPSQAPQFYSPCCYTPLPPLSLSCNHGTNRIPLISSSGIQSIAPTQYLRPFGHNITSARTFSCLFIIFCNCCTFSDYKNSRQCERKQLIVKKFTNLRFIQPDRVGRQQITPQKINFL